MATCDQCGREESMPYRCRYCGGTFCPDHRLPENHHCPGLEDWNDPKGVFDSGFDDSVGRQGGRTGGLLGRVSGGGGSITGRGGLLAYFRGNATYALLAAMWVWFFIEVGVYPLLIAPRYSPSWIAIFVLSTRHPAYVWTWVTSIFSHGGFVHILFNSIVLYFFGPIVERRVGTRTFTALFFGAGIAAGLAQVLTSMALGQPSAVLGASGAIMAIMGVLTVLNPHLRVYLYFILPLPLWIVTIGFALLSLFFISAGGLGGGGIANLAHLTGLAIGLGYGERLKRQGAGIPDQLRFGPGGPGGGPGRRF